MTVLQALDRYYDRMAARGEAEPPGFSREKISFAIVLAADGAPVDVLDLRAMSAKRPQPVLLEVPAAVIRTAGILPNLMWDKTAYVLGRTAGEGKRTTQEHAAFKLAHLTALAGEADEGLAALRAFLERWTPERFDAPPFTPEMLDSNIVFQLDGEREFIHEREAAKRLVASQIDVSGAVGPCLITGNPGAVCRLHPTIKGVEGAQSSGASLVSFNLDAFTSYGKDQGANAPTSEAAAFRYGAALNRMLDRKSRNRIARPVGDASVVFWADTSENIVSEDSARAAEDLFAAWFEPSTGITDEDHGEAAKIRDTLESVAAGRPEQADLRLSPGTRFHVLGLAPNAARLSIRYWLDDDFGTFARHIAAHYEDLNITPRPWRTTPPSIQRLLVKTTALQEKFDNIPPLLAGELSRAILTGGRYPRTLLTAAIMRLRAGDDPGSGWHALAIRAVLARDQRQQFDREVTPMSLDKDNPNAGYQLGRLFAALETAQRMALPGINATIRDRYFGAASATPACVFPILLRGAQNHLSKMRKEHRSGWLEREIEDICDRLGPDLPRSLKLENQGRFAIGYYHQRKAQYVGRPAETSIEEGDDNHDD